MFDTWMHLATSTPFLKTLQIGVLAAVALVLRRVATSQLRRWAQKTGSQLDDAIVSLLSRAVDPLVLLSLLAASLNTLPLPEKFLGVTNRIVYLAVLFLVLYYGARTALLLLDCWFAKDPARVGAHEPVRFLTRLVFVVFATMILAENLGISLTALWTTLGVGSVAVALALQDTLTNFFAGVYLRLDNPLRLGDYVKLQEGDEGYVTQLGWRSTRIRTLSNNMVIVPNSKLASSIVTNFSFPSSEMSVSIQVNTNQNSDPDQVERILLEEATQAAGKVRGLLATPLPEVRFIPGFAESSLGFTLICYVSRYVDQFTVQDELRKRIMARCDREGIPIPAQRDVREVRRLAGAPSDLPARRRAS